MHKNIGFFKEEELIIGFNYKSIGELTNNGKHVIKEIFGHINDNNKIKCTAVEDYQKPDFCISIGEEKHYVSMKSGRSNIVHQEYVVPFCKYLKERGISNRTLQTILLYQYGDGTLDGSAPVRMTYEKLRYLLRDRIKDANEELNKNKEFVLSIIDRAIFKGAKEENIEADYLYHGDFDYGIVVSKTQLFKHCLRRDWKWMDNLHIGPIQIRPHARYIGKEIKREKSRQRLEFYWANYYEDLDYISKRYDG